MRPPRLNVSIWWRGVSLSQGVKQQWHEADHSPHTSAKVKNDWSYTSPPTVYLHGVDKDNLPLPEVEFIISNLH